MLIINLYKLSSTLINHAFTPPQTTPESFFSFGKGGEFRTQCPKGGLAVPGEVRPDFGQQLRGDVPTVHGIDDLETLLFHQLKHVVPLLVRHILPIAVEGGVGEKAIRFFHRLVFKYRVKITSIIEESVIDFATYARWDFSSTEDLLRHFDDNVRGAEAALQKMKAEDFDGPFELKNKGQLMYSQNIQEAIGSTLNHWVHHRGQLTVYMRLNDILVPSIYGPSADSKSF